MKLVSRLAMLMAMRKKQTLLKTAFCLLWVAGLGCITAILIGSMGSSGGYLHYLKLYGVGVLWLVFLLFAFWPEGAAKFIVTSKRFDKVVLFLILAVILIILVAQTIRLAFQLQWFPALVLGLVSAGLFNVLRDILAQRED